MRKLSLILATLLIAVSAMAQTAKNKPMSQGTPDFAYPEKVEADALRQLDRALRADDGDAAVGALVKFGLAKAQVSADSIPVVLEKVEAVRNTSGSVAVRSLLALLEARIYLSVYQQDEYIIDERETIAGASASDYSLWSRSQFLAKVNSLTDEAMKPREELLAIPLDSYKEVIDFERAMLTFYPSLYDFVANQSIQCLTAFVNYQNVLNPRLTLNPLDSSYYPRYAGDPVGRILDAYRSLVVGREGSAPAIRALRDEIEFITPRTFDASPAVASFPSGEIKRSSKLYDALFNAYYANAGTPYAIELLLPAESQNLSTQDKRTLYDLLTRFIAENGSYFNINGVKNLRNTLARKQVNVIVPTQAAKDVPVKVEVRSANVGTATVSVYDVTKLMAGKRESYCTLPAKRPNPVSTVEVRFNGTTPFEETQQVEITLPAYGLYVVEPTFEGNRDRQNLPVIACSNLSAGVFCGTDSAQAVVVDALTGAPVNGASLLFTPWSRSVAPSYLKGETDASGLLTVEKDAAGTLRPQLDADRHALAVNYYKLNETRSQKTLRGEIFTSLGLYRPGDTMEFSLVAYETDKGINSLVADRELSVALRDANYQVVFSQKVTTDSWGRARGEFKLPSDGLTGNFTLIMSDGTDQIAHKPFMVSDYKLPTFEVTVDDVKRPVTPADSAVISGRALTFAGFPVGEATVKLQLRVRTGFWFWATTSPVFFEAEAATGADGSFSLTVPAQTIASSPAPEGYFMADVAVTSPDGETRETSAGFNMGKPLALQLAIPGTFIVGKTPAAVEACGFNGDKQSVELNYEIVKVISTLFDEEDPRFETVKSGKCMSGDVSPLLSSLTPCVYKLRFTTVDQSLADEAVTGDITVYNEKEKICPVNDMLWLPASVLTADEAGEVHIPYGTVVKDARVLVVLADSHGRIVSTKWEKPAAGMAELKVKLPVATEQARVYLRIVSGLHSDAASVTVNPAVSKRKIEISTETFRDKVLPGNQETLRFRVKGVEGASPESAVILDMSNKAIDVLTSNPLFFSPWFGGMRGINIDGLYFGTNQTSVLGTQNYLDPVNIGAPSFRFYGLDFYPHVYYSMLSPGVRIRGNSMMMKAAATGATSVYDMAESVEEEAVDAAAPEDAGMLSDPKATAAGGAQEDETKPVFRPSEIPLAFFRPMLMTQPDGTLEVTYTVPDANTTWILRALAYNRTLDTAVDQVDIVASKPLMVSANAPRFMRTGDRITLQASVMNATDSSAVAHSVCQVLNASDMKVLATNGQTDSVAPDGRAVVSVAFEAPADVQAVIFRIRSTAGEFTDGEQTLIPILPSEQDVVESQMFYLAPGQDTFSMQLPAVKNGRAYLKYTENPAWEVVSALPGLREGTIDSSIDAAAALFSAAVADGLMKQYPEIARTLRRWRDNPSDSALVSMLEKNEQLKSVLLNSTPWVADALSQKERMQRLVLLLDNRNTSMVIEKNIAALARNVADGGGWCWTSRYPEVSEWCTMEILDMLGDLNRLGWLPADKRLTKMTADALAYIDKTAAADFTKYPKNDYTLYCYTRGKFPDVKQSTAAAKVTRATVQRIIASWKRHSVVMKAADAIILNSNGYNATARQILESLRQYATVTPEKGMWWQQLESTWFSSLDKVGCTAIVLDAFSLVDPGNDAVDKIRQWLVLEKTNTDWGNAIITSQVISSILTSGREWTVNPAGTAIHIGDTLLTPDREEHATGAFTEQITGMLSEPETMTIDRRADYPSYGAVVTMRRAAMDEIKAAGCRELTVEKSMSVFNGSEWVPADRFNVGDRVRVTLVLRADADMDYVVITDGRAAALEPVEQLPEPVWSEGLCFYRENRDSQTNLFIRRMPRGVYVLNYELFATQAGRFASGVAQAQSQYNPVIAAHSAGMEVTVE